MCISIQLDGIMSLETILKYAGQANIEGMACYCLCHDDITCLYLPCSIHFPLATSIYG